MYLASMGSSSKIRRAPNPTTSPPRLRSGHSRRRWKRSMGPAAALLGHARGDHLRHLEALAHSALVSESHPDGANPQPNVAHAASSKPRAVR